MNNAHNPCFPFKYNDLDGTQQIEIGLTKREFIAAMALQGLISAMGAHDVTDKDELASDAVGLADALLKQLDNDQAIN